MWFEMPEMSWDDVGRDMEQRGHGDWTSGVVVVDSLLEGVV